MARIRKNDTVVVISGKDKGKTGKVLRVWPKLNKALVEHVNLVKHFERRSQQNPSGGVVERESALPLSKLALIAPKTQEATRIGWQISSQGKVRISRKTGEVIEAK